MPRADIVWRDVWVGAIATALLFTIGRWLIGLYLGKSAVTSGFGAAGSMVVLLVWVYYSRADLPARRGVHLGVRPRERLAGDRERQERTLREDAVVASRGADRSLPIE